MKKQLALFTGFIFVIGFTILSCNKKKSEGISPTYGSTGNPNPSNITVTGNATPTNPATNSTSMFIGGSGWTNPTCGTTNSLALKAYNGIIDVTVSFNAAVSTGTYAIGSTPGLFVCSVSVINAPNQPSGIVWYGRSGSVVVTNSGNSINAKLIDVVCRQQSFDFPTVLVTGNVGCTQ